MYCPNCGSQQGAGANFCSGCGTRLGSVRAAPPLSATPLPALSSSDVAPERPDPDAVKVLDAGDKLLLSGGRSIDVAAALARYVKKGAREVTPVCQVGASWTAACTFPPKGMDDTQSLSLAEVSKAGAAKPDAPDDGCRVEELGFKRIVYGPSLLAVKLRIEHLKQFGAHQVGEIEEAEGEWVAVCDTGGAANTGYKW